MSSLLGFLSKFIVNLYYTRISSQIRKEKPKVTFSVALDMAFLAAENENHQTTGRFTTGWFWLCTRKISFVVEGQFNNWEYCLLKIRPIVCFYSDSTHVFILSAPTQFTIFIRRLSILLFSFIDKVDFPSVKSYCVHLINKITYGRTQI